MKITFCLAVGLVPSVMFPLQSHASENQVPQTPAVVIEVVILCLQTILDPSVRVNCSFKFPLILGFSRGVLKRVRLFFLIPVC
ncbi:MAG: hypothetical protein ACKO4S_09385 [Snowella sp.]